MDLLGKSIRKMKDYRGKSRTVIHHDYEFGFAAGLAISLIERWGLVAAKPDGEDMAGRQKLSLLEPVDVVERACSTAELALNAFEKRGWLIQIPPPNPDEELAII